MAQQAASRSKTAIAAIIATLLTTGLLAYVNLNVHAAPELPEPPAAASTTASSPASAKTQAPAAALPAASPAATSATAPAAASATQPAAKAPHARTREQAAAALLALPELQAWSALLEKNSGGKTHGALVEYDPTPRLLHGKSYWQFSFVENSAEAALRWESFLASSSDDEILVEDGATDELLSLERWRKEKHPAQRQAMTD